MPEFPMPAFRDEGDPAYTWVWDGTSKSYIQIPSEEADHPDRSHSSGGDNELFDPAVHREKAVNPLQEGILASFADHECQRCGSPLNTDGLCTVCDHGLFSETAPMNTRTIPFPERAPKPNSLKTDISFPSQMSHVKVTTNHEIGKFVIDMDGNLHYEPGGSADTTRIRTRDHITSPGAEGTIFADGVGQITMLHPGFVPEEDAISQQLADAFGEGCTLEPVSEHLKLDSGQPVRGDMSQEFRTFAHVDEEMEFLASNPETLNQCPECGDVMVPGLREAACHSCGHRQPVLYTVAGQKVIAGPALLALPIAEELAGGMAGGLGGGGEMGLAGASAAAPGGMGGMMSGALGMGRNQMAIQGIKGLLGGGGDQPNGNAPVGPTPNEAVITHLLSAGVVIESAGMFGEKELGLATKNRGEDDNPALKGTQGFNEEHGGQPELFKGVADEGGSATGDEKTEGHDHKLKSDAMKAFHMNLPLILEFAESDEAGIDNPILKALDDLLESAFPGYKGQQGEGDATHSPENPDPAAEVVMEDPEEPSDDSGQEEGSGDKPKSKEAATPVQPGQELPLGVAIRHGLDAPTMWGMPDPDWEDDQAMGGFDAQTGEVVPREHLGWSMDQPSVPGLNNHLPGATPGAIPPSVPTGAPGGMQPGSVNEQPCPKCGYPHAPGVPCGGEAAAMPMQQPPTQSIASLWRIADDSMPEHGHHHPSEGSGDTSDKSHGMGGHPGHDWVDESGQPLQEGQEYEMISPNYAVPDKVVVDRILPDKLVYTVKTDLMDYQDEMTKEDLANEGYTFSQAMQAPDSTDGFDAPQEHPIRPGQDSGAQVDDLSQPSTTVSHSDPEARDHNPALAAKLGWLMEDSSPVDVDPDIYASLMGQPTTAGVGTGSRKLPDARYAGKDYTPREQREFIDEPGTARNLDSLDLSGTHYPEDDVDEHFLW